MPPDWDTLEDAWQLVQPHGGAFLVIRDGWIVGEWGLRQPIEIASCTKSVTSMTMQRLFQLSSEGAFAKTITEDDFAYQYLPASWSTGQPEKQLIKIRHLMTMSSGLEGDDAPARTAAYKTRILGLPVEVDPDEEWVYASAPVDLLSLVVEDVTGGSFETFFKQEVAAKIGLGETYWSNMGTSTVSSAFALFTPRDFARFGYWVLNQGEWDDGTGPEQLIPAQTVVDSTRRFPSLPATVFGDPNFFTNDPESHLRYGKLFWTTELDTDFTPDGVSAESYYMSGFSTNWCYVIPKYDMVVVRLGTGPRPWDDDLFVDVMDKVMESVLDIETHAQVDIVGDGCGPGPVPPTLLTTPPRLGDTFNIMFPGLLSMTVHGIFYGLPTPSAIPMGSGCSLGVVYPFIGFSLLPIGQEITSLVLPPNPGLVGVRVGFQGMVSGNHIGTFLTNGVQITVGY